MTKKTKAETLAEAVANILHAKEIELKELEPIVDQDRQATTKAADSVDSATRANDLDSYRVAKKIMDEAEEAASLHNARREQLLHDPLISEEEYRALRGDVLSEVDDRIAEANRKATVLIKQLEMLAADLDLYIKSANASLRDLYVQVYRCADLPESRRRHPMFIKQKAGLVDPPALLMLMDSVRWGIYYAPIVKDGEGGKA